jgi:hypothetical protein
VEFVFGRNLASVAMKMFSYLLYVIKKFYKFYTLNVGCRDNAAIICIIFSIKRVYSNQPWWVYTTLHYLKVIFVPSLEVFQMPALQ